jgi:hypothetical protein
MHYWNKAVRTLWNTGNEKSTKMAQACIHQKKLASFNLFEKILLFAIFNMHFNNNPLHYAKNEQELYETM